MVVVVVVNHPGRTPAGGLPGIVTPLGKGGFVVSRLKAVAVAVACVVSDRVGAGLAGLAVV